ncbi:MAG: SMP-30/gluconolactonase/LRE family protein [Bacteroidota bacterium]
MKFTFWKLLLLILGLAILYLLFWPIDVDPVKWEAPAPPLMEGDYAINDYLANIEIISTGEYHGPEDIAIDSSGQIFAGVEEGKILTWKPGDKEASIFADTKGRPLGLHFDSTGHLIVADAVKGLLSVSKAGKIEVLSTEANGKPFAFTDDLEIAPDGKIYFSDASWKWGVHDFVMDLMEQRPYGRLLVYDPSTKSTEVLLEDLYFANGIAVSKNNDFVLVNETGRYRITRYWVDGPNKGQSDIFIDNLPGFPDGVSFNGDDIFWVALPSPRKASVDQLHASPFMKKIMLRFPKWMHPKATRYGFVLGLDHGGNVIYNLQDPAGPFSQVTSVQQFGDEIFLGSLVEPAFAKIKVPVK